MIWTPPWLRKKGPGTEEEGALEEVLPGAEEAPEEPEAEPEAALAVTRPGDAGPEAEEPGRDEPARDETALERLDAEVSPALGPDAPAKLPRPTPGAEIIQAFEQKGLRTDLPRLHPGDAVRVHATIREGDRERIQVFEGILIALKHGGNRRTITVRKTSFGIAVERIFPLHSPLVARIEVVRTHHVRRAKLYFLRKRKGKAARLREKRR